MTTTAMNRRADPTDVLTVADLTTQIKAHLEGAFPAVWVCGEISNFSRPQSGHCYFTLKDDTAQIRAVVWRSAARAVPCELHDGLEIVCRGHLDVYPPRGSYQLVIQELQPKGMGRLELALRQLRAKLEAEGLFAASRKRPLPRYPRRIGVVTSPTGAAIHDFLQVLARRWRGAKILIIPSRVQGEGASRELARQVQLAGRLQPPLDVLVVTRGGGSLEDLWAFNEEPLVRAIAAAQMPVVSAVGHEIDVTLADLAADVRALTPSEAAERVLPATEDVKQMIGSIRQRLMLAVRRVIETRRARLDAFAASRAIRHPHDRVTQLARRVDELGLRAKHAVVGTCEQSQSSLSTLAGKLDALSPLNVLGRGYSLTQHGDDRRVVSDARQLSVGEPITTRFARGRVRSSVDEILDE